MSMNLLGDCGAVQPLDEISAYLPQYSKSMFGRSTIMTNLVPHCTTACGATAAWVWLGGKFPDTIDVLSRSHFRTLIYGRRIRTFNRKVTPGQVSTIGGLKLTTPARTACDVILMGEDDAASVFNTIDEIGYPSEVDGAIWQMQLRPGSTDDAGNGGNSCDGKNTNRIAQSSMRSAEIRRKNDAAMVQSYRSQARETACALIQEFHIAPEDCLAILDANRLWPNQARAWRFFTSIRYCF